MRCNQSLKAGRVRAFDPRHDPLRTIMAGRAEALGDGNDPGPQHGQQRGRLPGDDIEVTPGGEAAISKASRSGE